LSVAVDESKTESNPHSESRVDLYQARRENEQLSNPSQVGSTDDDDYLISRSNPTQESSLFPGSEAAIMAEAFRKALRNPDFMSETSKGSPEEKARKEVEPLSKELVEEGIRVVGPRSNPARAPDLPSRANAEVMADAFRSASSSRSNPSQEPGLTTGADAAIMADAFRMALRKFDLMNGTPEESSEERARKETKVLNEELAEEGRDIRSVSSSQGVKVEVQSQHDGEPSDPNETPTESPNPPLDLSPLLPLPQVPAIFFAREGMTNELLALVERFTSLALFGAGGIGKSALALTLLHHNQVQAKFGRNRYSVRCDDLAGSLEGFVERLSDAIQVKRTTTMEQLRPYLESSPPLVLLLDGVDSILDPLAPEADKICATIEEIGRYQHVCLLTTSRMHLEISSFHAIEVPTLPEGGARDTFYSLSHMERSSAVDNLVTELDFHPLSINLLAGAVREKGWDELALLQAWRDNGTSLLKTPDGPGLASAIESLLLSPSIRNLGVTAREALEAISAFPGGVEERRMESMFPGIPGLAEMIPVLCRFSLVRSQDGFVRMLSPFRLYFLECMLQPSLPVIRTPGSDTGNGSADETQSAPCFPAKGGLSPPFSRFPWLCSNILSLK
jgi:hypothetical protein